MKPLPFEYWNLKFCMTMQVELMKILKHQKTKETEVIELLKHFIVAQPDKIEKMITFNINRAQT